MAFLCPYLYNTIVVLGVLTEHDGTLAVGAERGDQVGLEYRPQLEQEVEDRCLNILPSFCCLVLFVISFTKLTWKAKTKTTHW